MIWLFAVMYILAAINTYLFILEVIPGPHAPAVAFATSLVWFLVPPYLLYASTHEWYRTRVR